MSFESSIFSERKGSFGGLREGVGGALPLFCGKREPETDPKGHAQIFYKKNV